jgi:hypothetical protein
MNRSRGYRTPQRAFRFMLRTPRTLLEVAFVLNVYGQLLEVPRFPFTEVCFQDHMGSLEYPTELGLVGKPDTHVEHSFFKDVLDPIDDLSSDARILFACSLKARLSGRFAFGHGQFFLSGTRAALALGWVLPEVNLGVLPAILRLFAVGFWACCWSWRSSSSAVHHKDCLAGMGFLHFGSPFLSR